MPRNRLTAVALAAAALFALAGVEAEAQQCGSALLLETEAPAVFDQLDPSASSTVRFWAVGTAASDRSDLGCQTGCTAASGPLCSGGDDCLALTGVNWINATCAAAGTLPQRTAFLVEQLTVDSGGRWAALNLDRNAEDANTDLDAKAASVCGGCASVISPLLGGDGRPEVISTSVAGGMLVLGLSWIAPPTAAQALSNGADLVTGYAVFYRSHQGTPPPATGDPTGWTWVADTEGDAIARDGYSADTTAVVEIPLAGLSENVTVAIGLSFDGSGNPTADPDTLASAYLSDDSAAVAVPTPCGEPNDLVLENQTVTGVEEHVGCLTVTAGNGFEVAATGDLTLRAGRSVTLTDGFKVQSNGKLAIELDPGLAEFEQ